MNIMIYFVVVLREKMAVYHGDVYDEQLNLAHQQARKADVHQACGKFDEAIICHEKAADYLTQVLTATSCTTALQSLHLQKDRHLRQVEIIRNSKSKQPVEVKCDKPHVEPNETTFNEKPTNGVAEKTSEIMSERLYNTMEQCDTLLCYLEGRPPEMNASEVRFRKHHKPFYQSGVKIQKDDKQIIEELRVHSESLQSHIVNLLQEREQFKVEIARLKSENERLCRDRARHDDRWVTSSSDPLYIDEPGLLLGSLDLPPLEMPKFDFDLLTGTHDRD